MALPWDSVLICPDSFKETLTSSRAAAAMADGVRRVLPDAHITCLPMSDGGEGFVDAITATGTWVRHSVAVADPLGRPVDATWAMRDTTAVAECAATVGLALVEPSLRDPTVADSGGLGTLIRACLEAGATQLWLGLGGSATNDGGAGMLRALGWTAVDARSHPVELRVTHLSRIARLLPPTERPWERCRITVASDVASPLLGPDGATATFAPQKGAGIAQLPQLEAGLSALAAAADGTAVVSVPGAGAAGGLGWALTHLLGGQLAPGAGLVWASLEPVARTADVVVTGEGRLDGQTAAGKAVAAVTSWCQRENTPVLVVAGAVTTDGARWAAEREAAVEPATPADAPWPLGADEAAAHVTAATARGIRAMTAR